MSEIRLYLDSDPGRIHGIRHWLVVPRIGDQITVNNVGPDGDSRHLRIRDVIWGDHADQCIVALMIDDKKAD